MIFRLRSIEITICVITFIFFACAKEGFPPGGPEDRTPPEVVGTIPAPGATFVDPYTTVQVWFSEGIKRSSASDAIFITPFPGDEVEYQWRGNRVKIQFLEPLKSDVTYVITLGTGIRDYRNNALKSSFTLAFSTGAVLDEGEIAGRVYGVGDGRGIGVWAYSIEESLDVDPSRREPDYIVQCGAGGEFGFFHVSPGLYRLFAVRDGASDRLYQAGEDEVGVTFRDVLLSRDEMLRADSLYFRMAKEDTSAPSLIRAVSLDRRHLTLRFDESLSSQRIVAFDSFAIVSAEDSLDTLSVLDGYLDLLNAQVVHILTQDQETGKRYRIIVSGLMDEAGNLVDAEYDEAQFEGIGEPDTTSPKLIQTVPRPGQRGVVLDGMVRLIFDEVLDTTRFREGFSLTDSLDTPVKGGFRWKGPSEVLFSASARLASRSIYEVTIPGKTAVDLAGNSLADTTFWFQTLDRDTLSEISGRVTDPDSRAGGNIYVIIRQLENSDVSYTQWISGSGNYRIPDILPGRYLLECFRDWDGNGEYSFGKVFPYQPAERFVVYQDTIGVRSRWPNEGNDLRLP